MDDEMESIGQHCPQLQPRRLHLFGAGRRYFPRSASREDVVAVGIQPGGAVGDLKVSDVVRALDETEECGVPHAEATSPLKLVSRSVGIGGGTSLDGGRVERLGLQGGYQQDRTNGDRSDASHSSPWTYEGGVRLAGGPEVASREGEEDAETLHHGGKEDTESSLDIRQPVMWHDAITERVLGAAMKVHTALGAGCLESTYDACFRYQLTKDGIAFGHQVRLPVLYDGCRLTRAIASTSWSK